MKNKGGNYYNSHDGGLEWHMEVAMITEGDF